MIKVDIRNGNRIVILDTPGKTPIRSRRSSLYFHNPMELLACSLGSCIGSQILDLCRFEDVDPRIFESIHITIENKQPKILIQVPDNIDPEFQKILEARVTGCEIANVLKIGPVVEFTPNDRSTEELIKPIASSCCGG
jgi:hypothetical protein